MSILDPEQLKASLDLQQRSYALLKWLADAIPRGFISFRSAHVYADSRESAFAWISEHYDGLPAAARPPERDSETLRRFANCFASYLDTSFDLTEAPETRLASRCGCYCSFCAVAVCASHLRAKRLSRPDKHRAEQLARDALTELAASQRLTVNDDALDLLLSDRSTREQAALVAYAGQLFRRCEGTYTGPWVLALWRMFAWHPTGSPKPKFNLTAETVLEAEKTLLERLAAVAA